MSDGEREPARETYDAIVDIVPGNRTKPMAYALVKRTYQIRGENCLPDAPEALLHDLRDQEDSPRLVPGTDFWPAKNASDFVVRGSAFAPRGGPVRNMTVSAQVGRVGKRIAVFGDRPILWSNGSGPRIGEPEPFTEMPLTWENAYGGIDFRVEDPEIEGPGVEVVLAVDHPGLYPRNPFGKGYLVESGEVPEMTMPNLEDPTDLLREDRLIVGDPRLWYRQPLPWCYDWVHPVSFPRLVYVGGGADAWYPGPQNAEMPEVQRGFLEPGYQGDALQRDIMVDPDLRFLQGASHGFTLPEIKPGTPVVLEGMHPERETIRFALPRETPSLVFEIDGKRIRGRPRLHSLVCTPAELKLTMVYGATVRMPRAFIPGIHRRIPLAVRIDGDSPLVYQTPLTLKERIERGEAERAARAEPAQEESR